MRKMTGVVECFFLFVFVCFVSVSCAQAAGEQNQDRLTLIYTTNAPTFELPMLVAKKKGWLNPKVIEVGGDANGLRALLSKSGDITFPGAFSVFSASSKGAKITAIGSWQGVSDYNLIVANDIHSLKNLEGKVYAGTGPSGPPEEYGKMLMRKHNIDISKVKFLALPQGHSDIVNAIIAGRASGGMVDTLSAQVGIRAGKIKVLTNMAKEFPDVGYIYSVVRSGSLENSKMRKKFQRFVVACIKADRFIMNSPNKAAGILVNHFPSLNKEDAHNVVKTLDKYNVWGVNGGMSKQQVADNIKIFKKNKMLPEATRLDASVFDYKFINVAIKKLGKW